MKIKLLIIIALQLLDLFLMSLSEAILLKDNEIANSCYSMLCFFSIVLLVGVIIAILGDKKGIL